MNGKLIKIKISKEQEKQFITIPFDVPENVEILKISYSYYGDNLSSLPKDNKNVIDIAILDEKGKEVGATGSDKKEIILSSSYSTDGYDNLEIHSGKWSIICGAYLIREEGVEISYNIEYQYKHERWLKGDFHLHSTNSDGKLTIPQIADKAKKVGLDFVAITDHNNFFHNVRLPRVDGLTIIPGVEYTHYNGHINFLGVKTPYDSNFAVNSFDEFKTLHNTALSRGAVTSINHAFCSLCPWKWPLEDFGYQAVEVWNGPMRKDNLKAIKWWHNELIKGRKLNAIAGSDFHMDYPIIRLFGMPVNHVYSCSKSYKDILDAVLDGKVTITRRTNSSKILMNISDNMIGDSLKYKDGLELKITVDCLKRGHRLIVYNNDDVILEYKAKKKGQYSNIVPIKNKGFVRAEIQYRPRFPERLIMKIALYFMIREQAFEPIPDLIYALTNPIYID